MDQLHSEFLSWVRRVTKPQTGGGAVGKTPPPEGSLSSRPRRAGPHQPSPLLLPLVRVASIICKLPYRLGRIYTHHLVLNLHQWWAKREHGYPPHVLGD